MGLKKGPKNVKKASILGGFGVGWVRFSAKQDFILYCGKNPLFILGRISAQLPGVEIFRGILPAWGGTNSMLLPWED